MPVLAALLACTAVQAELAPAEAALALHQRQRELDAQLQHNDFQQPLYLDSLEHAGSLSGDVHALLPHSFATLQAAITRPGQWCEVLILHLNVKQCDATPGGLALQFSPKQKLLLIGPLRLDLSYRVPASSADYLRIEMDAGTGPLGTRDYRIVLEAVPAAAGQSFVHFSYAYGYGAAARMAMRTYLSMTGSNKIGFSLVPAHDGQPARPLGGLRGAVERNTMRYYLALSAYLDSLSAPPGERVEQRLAAWFDATERYPRQLHELDREEYLGMKRKALQLPPPP